MQGLDQRVVNHEEGDTDPACNQKRDTSGDVAKRAHVPIQIQQACARGVFELDGNDPRQSAHARNLRAWRAVASEGAQGPRRASPEPQPTA
jgi:hypothetical protein